MVLRQTCRPSTSVVVDDVSLRMGCVNGSSERSNHGWVKGQARRARTLVLRPFHPFDPLSTLGSSNVDPFVARPGAMSLPLILTAQQEPQVHLPFPRLSSCSLTRDHNVRAPQPIMMKQRKSQGTTSLVSTERVRCSPALTLRDVRSVYVQVGFVTKLSSSGNERHPTPIRP